MERDRIPETTPALSISPMKFEIVFSEDPSSALSLVSPPLEDIREMADLEKNAFSLKDHIARSEALKDAARQRLHELLQKEERFSGSSTFLNRISNLYGVIGDLEGERRMADMAFHISPQPFFARKVGEAETKQGNIEGARKIFAEWSDRDAYSSLRLASFCVMERDFDRADSWLGHALRLNPTGYAERLFQGAMSMIRGEFAAAITFLRIALDDRPNSSVAYSNLGMAYLGVHRPDKAFESLKRSVALDPFNSTALLAFADVGSALGKDADIVSSIRYFVEFEQTDSSVWGRLARSLLRLNLVDDCVHALKRQGALTPTVAVWNNLGVAYSKQKKNDLSIKAFKHALALDAEGGVRQEILVARNIAALVSSLGQAQILLPITTAIITQDHDLAIAKDPTLSDVYSLHLHALMRLGREAEAIEIADNLLQTAGLSESLTKWIISTQASLYGLERKSDGKLVDLLNSHSPSLESVTQKDVRLLNNVAFAYAELGRLKEADECINRVSSFVHKDAYLTATLGLINIKKGNLKKGEALYREAIGLAINTSDKTRIRQKLNMELGRALASNDRRRGKQFLLKAAEERRGEPALSRQARRLLEELPKEDQRLI